MSRPQGFTPATEWRPVVGFEGLYEVSDTGIVRALDRVITRRTGGVQRYPARTVSQYTCPKGYKHVLLYRLNVQSKAPVHRLVLEAFIGPRPEGFQACHNDGDPANNHPQNLRWGTRSENILDQVSHGTHHHASKTHCKNQHLYDDSNTYIRSDGARSCRTCTRERMRTRRAKARQLGGVA